MKSLVEQTVLALTDATLADQLGHRPDDATRSEVAQVLLGKLRAMPKFLGSGMLGVTCLVGLSTLPSHGRPVHRRPREERRRRLSQLQGAPVNVLRDFASFYEKMGVFAYYCQVEAKEKAEGEAEGPQGVMP